MAMRTFADLRKQGIRHLEELAGSQWTDFNTHDPGITMLEAFCYALTDLGYRVEHDIPDLLANGGVMDPYASLHPPAALLTTRAVTHADLRRLILDIVGVKNAFIEQVDERLPANGDLVRGVYRIVVELSHEREGSPVKRDVGKLVHQNRGIGEDFAEIVVLDPVAVRIDAKIEIGRVDDPAVTYNQILDAIAEIISPTVPFTSLDERRAAGLRIDEIFDGPLLSQGFVTNAALARARRRTDIHSSDIVHAVMDVRGVRSVTEVMMYVDNKSDRWSLAIPRDRSPYLDRQSCRITLNNAGMPVALGTIEPKSNLTVHVNVGPDAGIAKPPFLDRNVAVYHSVMHHLPDLYGVSEFGLPDDAPPERKAKAKQLKAFLMFFDQLMANYLAQLAHAKDLFSIYSDPNILDRSYFSQIVNEPKLGVDAIAKATFDDLEQMIEAKDPRSTRKHRFLNHLLARFAENLNDRYAASTTDTTEANDNEKLLRDKQFFLQNYPRISGSRGTAFDDLAVWGIDAPSGLEDRIRLKLGLDAEAEETMAIVEHVHARPWQCPDANGTVQLGEHTHFRPESCRRFKEFEKYFANTTGPRDPYSLQLTFVFPGQRGRFGKTDAATPGSYPFRDLVEQTIRSQTPAHLTTYVLWLDEAEWSQFEYDHFEWRRRRREHLAGTLGINLGLDRALPVTFKGIPVLPGIVKVKKDSPRVVNYNGTFQVTVDSTQERAKYKLLRDSDSAVISAEKNIGTEDKPVLTTATAGTGSMITIDSTWATEDMNVRVQAERVLEQTVLLATVLPLRVRANPSIPITAQNALLDPGTMGTLKLENTQTSVFYRAHVRKLSDVDFFVPTDQSALAVPNVPRVRVTVPPEDAMDRTAYRAMGLALRGTGGQLLLPFGRIDADSVVVVRAHKEHGATPANATDVQMATAVVFLARPAPAPNLTLSRISRYELRVTGGEPGVFYQLVDINGAALGNSVYFHRQDEVTRTQNRGIGRLRITRDFVVTQARTPADGPLATTPPVAPTITLSAPIPTTGLFVMATRARTNVSWTKSQSIAITG